MKGALNALLHDVVYSNSKTSQGGVGPGMGDDVEKWTLIYTNLKYIKLGACKKLESGGASSPDYKQSLSMINYPGHMQLNV